MVSSSSPNRPAGRPLWWDHLPEQVAGRPPLTRDLDVDVAIVGAGYTGLWTAHYLLERDPTLSIAVVDAHHVGYGASGRNGGWCYDGFAAGPSRIEQQSDHATAVRWGAVLREAVDEVGRVTAGEGIGCDYHKGGSIDFLRNPGQLARARAEVEEAHHYGWTAADTRVLPTQEACEIARAAGVLGGLWSANTAAIQPAKLVHGLAAAVGGRGVQIFESTPATEIGDGQVVTPGGTISAGMVVRATEGYTRDLPGLRRLLAPLYSLMIATEPISDDRWNEIGLANRETFGDLRHLVIYGQRTADGRVAFGGRGAPYDYASRIRPNAVFPPAAFDAVHAALLAVFPQLREVPISHRWGGVLGVPRDWHPSAGIDSAGRLAYAGGYVGSGVAATNIAGRTLADLITGHQTELTLFPWVNRRRRRWPPEPLRWAGINTGLWIMQSGDEVENRGHGPARRADLMWRIVKIGGNR